MKVYLDAAPVIYLVERVAPYLGPVLTRVSPPEVAQVVSELTRLECRVRPIKTGNRALLGAFDEYFADVAFEIVPLSHDVVEMATDIRAHYRFKTPDALHLAAAIVARCDVFCDE